jgi:hypothetical protein
MTVTAGAQSATASVTVSATGTTSRTFWGTAVGPGGLSGTLAISLATNSRALGTVYLSNIVVSLLGRVDAPTNIVNVSGGGYTFLGTLDGNAISGTFTDPAGNTGGFSALDSTHTAVTAFCGTYTSDDTSGAWNLQASADGTVSAESVAQDGSSPSQIYAGGMSGATISLVSKVGLSATGSISGDVAAGTVQMAAGGSATFSASTAVCH